MFVCNKLDSDQAGCGCFGIIWTLVCCGARDGSLLRVPFAIDDTVQQLSRLLLTFHSWVTPVWHLMLGYVFSTLYHFQESFSQFLSINITYKFLQKSSPKAFWYYCCCYCRSYILLLSVLLMFLLLLVSYCEVTVSGVADASVSVVWNFSFQIKKTYHKSICKILLFNASLTIIYKFTRLLLNILFQDQDTLYGTRALQMAGTIILRFCYLFSFSFILLKTLIRPLVLAGRSGGPVPCQLILG